jgi:iron complex outermembrane receptor protein
MRKSLLLITYLLGICSLTSGQYGLSDSLKTIKLEDVIIKANRLPVLLKNNPGSISVVTPSILSAVPKAIAIDEALRLTPGVRIDNQHDGERVHVSIRGQGILTERGLRGIGVILDGIPVNDPSGFAPDLYDVDWATVDKIEVLRGPAASLYGGGGAAGVINISTSDGGPKPVGGEVNQTVGSNGFSKELVQLDGTKDAANYRISYSRTDGTGYRDHQGFWANNLYEKINFKPSEKFSLAQIVSHTDYFQQNPEGLSLDQLIDPRQANPDARPFNEYQKTNRTTIGLHGVYKIDDIHDLELTTFLRSWKYKETSNKAAEYRDITNPGISGQYNFHFGNDNIKNTVSVGIDMKWQNTRMYKLQSAANPMRVESSDETNLETDTLLANQIIVQRSIGAFALYKLKIGGFNLIGSLRHDKMDNKLTDKLMAPDTAVTMKKFSKASARLGINYSFSPAFSLFANWSQGFVPPSTEELASNPVGYNGFNTHLVPATSNCSELGIRGDIWGVFFYDLTGFVMNTKNDFFRFKQSGRGNQEVFYGNAGNSKRYGIELFMSNDILTNLKLQASYTFADYKYTSAEIDPVYTDPQYVLTSPPAQGQWLPNSPKNQFYAELAYSATKKLTLSLSTEYQSKWAIYTDSKAYSGELDPSVYQNWQDGFNLYHARMAYAWKLGGLKGSCSLYVRNIFSSKYIAFTEPDPDGNSYQPGPVREIFGNIKINF